MANLRCFLGVIGSGKDYQSKKFLSDAKAFGYKMEQVNFADPLREMAWKLLSWEPKNAEEYEQFKNGFVATYTNDKYFQSITGRQYLQNLGTTMREIDPNFWAKRWADKTRKLLEEGIHVVCSDLRYPNELIEAFMLAQCYTKSANEAFLFCDYRSERYEPDNEHSSEHLAQRILKDGYRDGQALGLEYLASLMKIK